jgi:hypothetical protein
MTTAPLHALTGEPHRHLAVTAFLGFRNYVLTACMTEAELRSRLSSVDNSIPQAEAEATIARAFDAARRKRQ